MHDAAETTPRKPDVPEEMQARWQRIVDLVARIVNVPAGAIMRVDLPEIEVFLSSASEGNPLPRGARFRLDTSIFCEKVMRERAPLLVPDALKDPQWEQNPGISLGITYYLGFPILWPDGQVFGTICVFDRKDNAQVTRFQELLSQFRQLIEKDLHMLVETREREALVAELQRHRDDLRAVAAEQIAALARSKEVLEERTHFENLISNLSPGLVKAPLDRVGDEIANALQEIRQFFGADACALLEVLADHGEVRFVDMTDKAERRRQGLSAEVGRRYPWANRRLIEQGEPVIFSSLEALPPEASEDRAAWEQEGTQAVLALPLRVGGKVTHLIALRSQRSGHEWPEVHVRRLRVYGKVIANVLMHQSAQEALLRHQRELAEAQRLGHVGSEDWDIVNGHLHWSDELYRIVGRQPQERDATFPAFLAAVHPEDRGAVEQALNETLAGPRRAGGLEHRVVRPDGTQRIVDHRWEVILGADGRPARVYGTVLDITDRKQTEEALRQALEEIGKYREQLEAENIYLREAVDFRRGYTKIVGTSGAMQYLMSRVRQVAQTKATVLLTGETGTGKGVIAHILHEASGRKDKPFVHVNCAGLPPNLIESELFGREKGAFTGSTARQIGRFELANGGTIYLDEIGELPLDLQAKLLRVIEDGEFERLGSPHAVKVDVRIIASTNRHLEEEMRRGQFRKDLFFRLNVFPIDIPPLRSRREDIPLLVRYFADRFSKGYGRDITNISTATMKALENYAWPGNVRELINVIERAVIVSSGNELRLAEKIDALPVGPPQGIEPKGFQAQEARRLVEVEREHILGTLQRTGWRIEGDKGAAHLLGINPSTMRARMRKLGITRPTTH